MSYAIPLIIIIFGLLEIFAKDLMWKVSSFWISLKGMNTEWNRLRGLPTERTEFTDQATTFVGIFLIVLALVSFFLHI